VSYDVLDICQGHMTFVTF